MGCARSTAAFSSVGAPFVPVNVNTNVFLLIFVDGYYVTQPQKKSFGARNGHGLVNDHRNRTLLWGVKRHA